MYSLICISKWQTSALFCYALLPDIGALPLSGHSAHREQSGSVVETTGSSIQSGAAGDAALRGSDIGLFRQDQSIINRKAEVTDCALLLGMAEQELAGSQISDALVDQRDLRPPQAVRAV